MLWSPFTKTDSLTLSCYHYCYCISHLFSSQLIYLVISIFYHYFYEYLFWYYHFVLFPYIWRATAKIRLLSARFIRLTYVVYRQYLITIFLTCSHEEFMKKNQVLFSDVFRGYRKRPVACIRLRNIVVKQITHHMVTQKPHSCCQVPANNLTNNLN